MGAAYHQTPSSNLLVISQQDLAQMPGTMSGPNRFFRSGQWEGGGAKLFKTASPTTQRVLLGKIPLLPSLSRGPYALQHISTTSSVAQRQS